MPRRMTSIMANSSKKSPLQHHFVNLNQQYDASQLGMWAFLITEILFFGALFTGYTIYRMLYPTAFGIASGHLDITLGAINTAVLIASSLTMALAVHAGHTGNPKKIIKFLLLTILLGSVFLGIKAVEYSHKFHEHLVPGPHFGFHLYTGPGSELFFSFYFAMTGLHAFHMVVGIIGLFILVWMAHKGKFTEEYSTPVEMMGLYWHFVDIVWIFLFPLLYLVMRHH